MADADVPEGYVRITGYEHVKDLPPVPGEDIGPITNVFAPNHKGFCEESFLSVIRMGEHAAASYRLIQGVWVMENMVKREK